ncbi:hypothetical protein [Pyrobaculum ferrireducens]|uniref:Uncharacterized protein n=1 Tax=Pyrobaculum ferrireducens TaxID=1104324 RepID=G7VC67_9CREN|nr:hypothetical protein [Pyrobaculum ferrireducens]AET33753.1 hypothetical protein P186_2365 [Pyrobaculum ferrireducens]
MRGLESFDMLIAFTIVALFVVGIYFMMGYFPFATGAAEVKASVGLDAQEVLKKIIQQPGSPADWTDINQVQDLGLADSGIPGQLDPKKLLALASLSGGAEAVCRIRTSSQDYPVTKVGYGIYLWGTPSSTQLDPSVYQRVLKSLFGSDWDKYDIELVIRPALKINLDIQGGQTFISITPPGVYALDACAIFWASSSSAAYNVEIIGAYYYSQGGGENAKWYFNIRLYNSGTQSVQINSIKLGGQELLTSPVTINPGDVWCNTYQLSGKPADTTVAVSGPNVYVTAQAQGVKPVGGCAPPNKNTPSIVPQQQCFSGGTDADGRAVLSVPGNTVFTFVRARGAAVRGVNYTYPGSGQVSLVGLVAKQDAGVYIIHSKLIQNIGSTSLCGCDDPGVSALGLRAVYGFLGGQTSNLLQDVTINPSVNLDLGTVCGNGVMDKAGCLIPWGRIGRAKFLVVLVERNSNGDPPKCGEIPQRDVIVMPLTGGLPPLYEVRFATWWRWVGQRPEALVTSYAEALADSGEITYKVELWVFRYR